MPRPLLHHIVNIRLSEKTVQLTTMRELVSRWGADIRIPPFLFSSKAKLTYMMLHVCAARGEMPLVRYFIEECGLSVDELTPGS